MTLLEISSIRWVVYYGKVSSYYTHILHSVQLIRVVNTKIRTVVTPHAQRERGKVMDRGVHIYIYYICLWSKKYLNRTLEINSPFKH